MQIINTIELVCESCGKPIPYVYGPRRYKVRGVWMVEVMPGHSCAESGVAADAESRCDKCGGRLEYDRCLKCGVLNP